MSLINGTKLGPYEIVSPAGAGGMGEVYRAKDTRLDRAVAIKVLPQGVAGSPELRERFEREARTISNLSHPNICTLHDIGQQDGVHYLVLEYIEGETLEQRLEKGPLSAQQVLKYAIEIADALDKAHRQGIIHRDLKPGNIMLTKAGAKLLDFGLAKLADEPVPAVAALDEMATQAGARKLTAEGMLLGTFQYMAPEQLEGRDADQRTDIFALGAVIYEMAAGIPAFKGKTKASLIAAILSSEPKPISELQPMTPPALDRVVKTCLAKDPDDRWQTAHDVKLQLQWIAEGGSQAGVPAPVAVRRKARERGMYALVAVLLLAVAALAVAYWRAAQPPPVVRSELVTPENSHFNFAGDNSGPPVLSPDGRRLAMSLTVDSRARLYVRALDSSNVQPLPGTENASFPFWSPDSQWLAFFVEGKLKKINVNGGAPITIADAPDPRGGTWSVDGAILFAPRFRGGLSRVPANGGAAEALTTPDGFKYTTHRWPFFLPDGKHFLYFAGNHNNARSEDAGVFYASLDGKQNRRIVQTLAGALYVPGYLLFLAESTLMAQAFDPSSGESRGQPFSVADGVASDAGVWRMTVTASDTGILTYQPAAAYAGSQLVWYERNGQRVGTVGEREAVTELQLSPDSKKLAVNVGDPQKSIWSYDLVRNTRTRLTFSGDSQGFVWSPDGKRIVFAANTGPGGHSQMFVQPSDGSAPAQPLLPGDSEDKDHFPASWSRDGRYLLFVKGSFGSQGLWVLPMDGGKPFPAIQNPSIDYDGQFSPDGRWIAYATYQGGRSDIFVAPFPPTGAKWQVSQSGGSRPRWRRDGKELFFVPPGDNQFYAMEVNGASNTFQLGRTQALFRTNLNGTGWLYDVSADGRRFIVSVAAEQSDRALTLVVNWTSELKK